MKPFSVNDVFSDRQTGLCYRILWIAPDASSLYTIPTTGNSGMPSMVHAADLSARFADGCCEPAGDPFAPPDNKSGQMMKSGVNAVPVDLWNWGIRNQSGALRTFPEETVRLALLPRSNASVTELGIRFKGIFYSCQEARDSLWFEKARKEGRYSVGVSYDPQDLSRIYVRNAPAGSYLLCDLLDWQQRYEGKSLDEVEFEEEKRKAEEKKTNAAKWRQK